MKRIYTTRPHEGKIHAIMMAEGGEEVWMADWSEANPPPVPDWTYRGRLSEAWDYAPDHVGGMEDYTEMPVRWWLADEISGVWQDEVSPSDGLPGYASYDEAYEAAVEAWEVQEGMEGEGWDNLPMIVDTTGEEDYPDFPEEGEMTYYQKKYGIIIEHPYGPLSLILDATSIEDAIDQAERQIRTEDVPSTGLEDAVGYIPDDDPGYPGWDGLIDAVEEAGWSRVFLGMATRAMVSVFTPPAGGKEGEQ